MGPQADRLARDPLSNGWDDEGEDGGSGLSGLSRWTYLAGLGALLLAGLGHMAYLLRRGSRPRLLEWGA